MARPPEPYRRGAWPGPARTGEIAVVIAPLAALRDVIRLPQTERARAAATGHAGTRAAFVAGRVLLRTVLADVTGLAPDAVPVTLTPAGKPATVGLEVSLAHAERWVALALARAPVGIDMEENAPTDSDALAPTVMDETELAAFMALRASDRGAAFLRLWTRKEAVLKAIGTGFGIDPRTVTTRCDGEAGQVAVPGHDASVWWRDLGVTERPQDAILALASTRPIETVRVLVVSSLESW